MRLIFLSAVAAGAFAASTASADYVKFEYHAGELATQDSAETLYVRLSSRAKRLCRMPDGMLPSAEEACFDRLRNDWVSAIHDERLNAIHHRETEI